MKERRGDEGNERSKAGNEGESKIEKGRCGVRIKAESVSGSVRQVTVEKGEGGGEWGRVGEGQMWGE